MRKKKLFLILFLLLLAIIGLFLSSNLKDSGVDLEKTEAEIQSLYKAQEEEISNISKLNENMEFTKALAKSQKAATDLEGMLSLNQLMIDNYTSDQKVFFEKRGQYFESKKGLFDKMAECLKLAETDKKAFLTCQDELESLSLDIEGHLKELNGL